MKYLINRANITLEVKRIMMVEKGYRIIAKIPGKKPVLVIAHIHKKKMREDKIERGKVYNFEGYFTETKYMYDGMTHKLQLNIDDYELNDSGEVINAIHTVAEYVRKTQTVHVSDIKKVCNIYVDYLSENIKDAGMEIVVWNRAVDVVKYARQGQQLHMLSFIYDNFYTDSYVSLKLSPFKITLL